MKSRLEASRVSIPASHRKRQDCHSDGESPCHNQRRRTDVAQTLPQEYASTPWLINNPKRSIRPLSPGAEPASETSVPRRPFFPFFGTFLSPLRATMLMPEASGQLINTFAKERT